jgi:hypothetical protein
VTLSLSREPAAAPACSGRVTSALEQLRFEAKAADFEATAVLPRRGARRIFAERY